MTEQWRELKETITEMRDNGGTGTQQEVCKFLADYMETLEKQMQEPCEDCISREQAIEKAREGLYLDDVITELEWLPSVIPQRPNGKWIVISCEPTDIFKCSECGMRVVNPYKYCPNCGAEMIGGGEDEVSN